MHDAIIVTVTKKYREKYYPSTPVNGILAEWDKLEHKWTHFKVRGKPARAFRYVIVNIAEALRGYFELSDVQYLTRDYDRSLFENFGEGWFTRCNCKTWKRFPEKIPWTVHPGFSYASLSSFL
jgi:hypothetical protein